MTGFTDCSLYAKADAKARELYRASQAWFAVE